MKVVILILFFLLDATISYNQTAFSEGGISIDYTVLNFDDDQNFQLSENLFRVQVSTNVSARSHLFLNFIRHNLKINKSSYSVNYPLGIGYSCNFRMGDFSLSLSASISFTRYVMDNNYPYIKWYKSVLNIGGSPSILYRLPVLNHNLFLRGGVYFNVPLKSEVFRKNSTLQLFNGYPFIGISYRLKGSEATD